MTSITSAIPSRIQPRSKHARSKHVMAVIREVISRASGFGCQCGRSLYDAEFSNGALSFGESEQREAEERVSEGPVTDESSPPRFGFWSVVSKDALALEDVRNSRNTPRKAP